MSDRNHIEEVAAKWIGRKDRGLSSEEAETLELWLAEATAHRVVFLRLEAAWSRADRLAAFNSSDLLEPRERAGYWEPTGVRLLAAAALIAALCSGAIYYSYLMPQDVYATAIGQRKAFKLADGTKIELNTDTHMQAKVTKAARTVTLDRGQAYFEVVHDEKRPFVVYAGNRRITDLGTKFSVLREGNHIQVVVKEGRVRVDILNNATVSAPVFADGGNVVVARADETLVAKRPAQEIVDELNWRTGTLIFNQETLSDAAAEFNRYNTTKIIVEGNARDVRIGGSFRADNINVFATLIKEGFGLAVRRKDNEIVISE